ncbi:MAG: glycosyltransferase N-terminal domain-containing protein, partial [Candidatus Omnitrophota bacterium]
MVLFYDFLFVIFSLLYLPYLLLKKKWHKGFWARFGFLNKEKLNLKDKGRIWVHAVSVGEVLVVKNLLPKIRVAYP